MRSLLQAVAFGAALCASGGAYAADNFTISADQWALPRSGAALVRFAPLRAAVKDWLDHPEGRIVIVESGSDTSNLWAGELADWLVALGVPADRIGKRVSGVQGDDSITLSVDY
jgi:hypothetical protein